MPKIHKFSSVFWNDDKCKNKKEKSENEKEKTQNFMMH